MQVFFALSYSGIDRDKWSIKKFHAIVTEYIKAQPGFQIRDLKEGAGWNLYLTLISANDDQHAIEIRKTIESLCKDVSAKCRPYYFRRRKLDVESISDLSLFGLTGEESKLFQDKAPAGTLRHIDV